MKKSLIITGITLFAIGSNYAQTNRINHYSHSGSSSTLDIFKSNDNMGLGCGSAFYEEVSIDTTAIFVMPDTTVTDSLKVCKPKTTNEIPPRRGMSFTKQLDVKEILLSKPH